MKTKVLALVAVLCLMSASTVGAACYPDSGNPPCAGNFDYDCDVDSDDVDDFLSHFGRRQYNTPCPSNGPAPVPKTGQTTSYASYDDGYYEKGVQWPNPRFTDNLDGTITDNLTGLIWMKNANCSGPRTWDSALDMMSYHLHMKKLYFQ